MPTPKKRLVHTLIGVIVIFNLIYLIKYLRIAEYNDEKKYIFYSVGFYD